MLYLYDTLRNDPAVADLLAGKIYPQVAPQQVIAPYATYNIVSELPSECREKQEPIRVQVSIFTEGWLELQNIKKAVKKALHGKRTPEFESDFINAVDLYENGDLLRHSAMDFQLISK